MKEETAEFKALKALIALAGGWAAFVKLSGCGEDALRNWWRRGQVSERWAMKIGSKKWARSAGWTKETIRPDIKW